MSFVDALFTSSDQFMEYRMTEQDRLERLHTKPSRTTRCVNNLDRSSWTTQAPYLHRNMILLHAKPDSISVLLLLGRMQLLTIRLTPGGNSKDYCIPPARPTPSPSSPSRAQPPQQRSGSFPRNCVGSMGVVSNGANCVKLPICTFQYDSCLMSTDTNLE